MSVFAFKVNNLRNALDACRKKQVRVQAAYVRKIHNLGEKQYYDMKMLFEEDARLCKELTKILDEEAR